MSERDDTPDPVQEAEDALRYLRTGGLGEVVGQFNVLRGYV